MAEPRPARGSIHGVQSRWVPSPVRAAVPEQSSSWDLSALDDVADTGGKGEPQLPGTQPLAQLAENQALSRQWLAAGGASVLPLLETEEEEGPFVSMDQEWQEQVDQELSRWGAVSGQELGLGEELPFPEFPQGEEDMSKEKLSQGEDRGSSQGLSQWAEDISDKTSELLEEAESASAHAQQEAEEGVLAAELKLLLCNDEEITEPHQGDASSYEDMCQGEVFSEEELSQIEASSNHELFDCDEYNKQELSLGKGRSYKQCSDGEECLQPGLSPVDVISSLALSDWEGYSKHELSPDEDRSYQEVSEWEEFILQELSQDEDSISQEVPKRNWNPPSVQSSWEDDGDKELERDDWQSASSGSFGVKPLPREEDEWDDTSVLELFEEPRQPVLGGFAGDGLAAPFPQEVWVEPLESERGPQAPLRASSGRVQAQALSQQLGPRKKRPSRFWWALRALRSLFRCPCLAPQPED